MRKGTSARLHWARRRALFEFATPCHSAPLGVAWNSEEWHGVARSGKEWQGVARSGKEWQGVARSGKEWQGVARSGKEWRIQIAHVLRAQCVVSSIKSLLSLY